jgi:1,4-dihydroxy-2-naphthoate octaprenyltransferase
MTTRRTPRLGQRPGGLLRIAWCGWLTVLMVGYAIVGVAATVATVRAWHAWPLGRLAAGVLVGSYAVELWWLAQLARRAARSAWPAVPSGDVATEAVLAFGLLVQAWVVFGR